MDRSQTDAITRQRRGLLIVLSSPSGAGKTTISRMLLDADDEIAMSVSATTRPMRNGEHEGKDYHFVDDDEFDRMIGDGEFVEWANVFGYRYGTPKQPVKDALREGRDILFDIDWQGARQLEPRFQGSAGHASSCFRRRWPSSSSACETEGRTCRRWSPIGCSAPRTKSAIGPNMNMCSSTTRWTIAWREVRSIIAAERSKRVRQTSLNAFVRGLIGPEH